MEQVKGEEGAKGLQIKSRVGRGKQHQTASSVVLLGQIRRQWTVDATTRDKTGRDKDWEARRRPRVSDGEKICGKRTKAETKQFDVREGRRRTREQAGARGGRDKTEKRRGSNFCWPEGKHNEGHTEAEECSRSRTTKNSRKDQKGHPKEFAFTRKHKK